jgi:hypothetical protein
MFKNASGWLFAQPKYAQTNFIDVVYSADVACGR